MAPDAGQPAAVPQVRVRALLAADLPEVVRIDRLHTGKEQAAYWRVVFERFGGGSAAPGAVGLCADGPQGLCGYLFGEVREVEFGSEPCGWVFAIGVDPAALRHGTASALLLAAVQRFAALGVGKVRTMVARNDVPVLSFFRASGFVGGPYVQLELHLDVEEART